MTVHIAHIFGFGVLGKFIEKIGPRILVSSIYPFWPNGPEDLSPGQRPQGRRPGNPFPQSRTRPARAPHNSPPREPARPRGLLRPLRARAIFGLRTRGIGLRPQPR